MKKILIALGLALALLPSTGSAQQKLQEIQIPDPVRDFAFNTPKVTFDQRMKEREIRPVGTDVITDRTLGIDVAERHHYQSHMGQTYVFTPLASRVMPQPAYGVTFSVAFPSRIVDLDAAFQNALNTFALRHAPSCEKNAERIQKKIFYFDDDWMPVTGPCDIFPPSAFGLMDPEVSQAALDGSLPRYFLYIGISGWATPDSVNDKTLTVAFQDNLIRAQYEARFNRVR